MRIVVIGGTGHIGTFLVPRLVNSGHEVIVVSRNQRQPYQPHPAWKEVRRVEIDRQAAEKTGVFGQAIRDLRPEVVMDMLCFDLPSARQLVEALRGEVQLLVHCGTIWVQGYGITVPISEDQPRNPLESYGRNKRDVEAYLLDQARRRGFPATLLHPGHIVGPGWAPVAPTACHDLQAFVRLARGEELALPNLGLETLHHVHADDVAQAFEKTLTHWSQAVGESFFIVSPAAVTLRGFAEAVAAWFGKQAKLRFLPLEEWKKTVPEKFLDSAIAHLTHSSHHSIAKAQRLLEYQPRYTSLEAVRESIFWLIDQGQLTI